jgi:hypothetical protein
MKNLLLLTILTLTSCVTERQRQRICNNCPQTIERHDTTIIKETVTHDTTHIPIIDSAFYRLYLKCVDGRVVIDREIKQLGKMINQQYTLDNNVLKIQSTVIDSLMNIISRYERNTVQTITETKTPIIVPENGLKWWHWLIGIAVLLILILKK